MNSRLRVLEKTVKPAAADNPYMSASRAELIDLAKEIARNAQGYPSELVSLCARIIEKVTVYYD